MQKRLIELHLQRGRLLERIANQRHDLSVQLAPLERAVHIGDRVAAAADQCKVFVLEHPLTVTAAVATVVVLRPRGVLRWTRRALVAWRAWVTVKALLPRFLAR